MNNELLIEITTREDGWQVMRVTGDLCLYTAYEFRHDLHQASRENSMVVVDLRGLDFFDSTGLGVLFAANKRAHGVGGQIRVVGGKVVSRSLGNTRLATALVFYDTVEQAINDRPDTPS